MSDYYEEARSLRYNSSIRLSEEERQDQRSRITYPTQHVHKPMGFACISLKRRREIASLGGKASQALGKAHKFTHEEAVEAGRLAQARRKGGSNKK